MHKIAPHNKELSHPKMSLVLKLKKPGLDQKVAADVLTETPSLLDVTQRFGLCDLSSSDLKPAHGT